MKNLSKKGILIAFGELFLKSEGVKEMFQRRLSQNLSFFLKKENLDFKPYLFHDRIFIEIEETKKAIKIIKKVFGISWVSESFFLPQNNLKDISKFVAENYKDRIKKDEAFAIRLKLEKGILKESKEKIIEKIAEPVKRKVNLSNPQKEIFIEVKKERCFIYFKKTKGAGGYPAGCEGKVLTLMSGGIDSPVAAYLIAKRGAENIWLHFHSFPLVSNKSIEKVKELAEIFLKYQPSIKIYFIPFQKAQLESKTKTPQNYRILLYRRLMLKIAELIAKKENCQALVTGESLGQVSSQTLPNIKVIEEIVKIPVLRPLIGMDKGEIIELAKKIGSFKISIRPQEDCCTLFTPRHPTAEGKIEKIKSLEKELNTEKIIRQIIKEAEVKTY